jgi:hypothetical protein
MVEHGRRRDPHADPVQIDAALLPALPLQRDLGNPVSSWHDLLCRRRFGATADGVAATLAPHDVVWL